nr:hypothetical protein CFP56_23925 [Quercus suber]
MSRMAVNGVFGSVYIQATRLPGSARHFPHCRHESSPSLSSVSPLDDTHVLQPVGEICWAKERPSLLPLHLLMTIPPREFLLASALRFRSAGLWVSMT